MKHPRLQVAAPPPTFEVTIVPRFVSPARRNAVHQPLRPRRSAAPLASADVSPLVTEAPPSPAPQLQAMPDGVRRALRRGPVGCANPSALDQAETDACLEAFGKGALSAAFIAPPMARDKRTGFDEKVAAQEQMRIYRETGVYSGLRDALKAAR